MSGQPKQRTKKQHYVAQLYLRGFLDASGQMFCFDKVSGRSHPTSTQAAAQEPNFYEIPSGSFVGAVEVPLNTIENALASIESMWAPIHAALIKCADQGTIPAALKMDFAPFLAIQWMRTRTYRDLIYAVMQQTTQSLADELLDLNFSGQSVKVRLGKESLAAMHAQRMLDLDHVEQMAYCFLRHRWVVGINKTSHPFFTSDHPVVRRANRTREGRPMVGLLDPGIEFIFPLDNTHILLVLERQHFANWAKHEDRSVDLTSDEVLDYNGLQVMRSNQRILCAKDDFDIAREICSTHPEVRNPERQRVLVEMTPIKEMKNYMLITCLE